MYKFVCFLCLWTGVPGVFGQQPDWDIAVTIEDRIELLNANGALKGITLPMFKNVKTLVFDDVKHTFFVSDVYEGNDTIYKLSLKSRHLQPEPVFSDVPDDIVGIALDSVENILYWTDSYKKRIMYASLQNENGIQNAKVLFEFQEEIPFGILVDVCRRKLYWTNVNHPDTTIERSDLNGSNREIIVKGNMFFPSGLAIDQSARRLYWSDIGEGIYFSIESSKLDGLDRRIILKDVHQSPQSITVGEDRIFWTDTSNEALWSLEKNAINVKPQLLRRFTEKPTAVVSKNHDYKNMPECRGIMQDLDTKALEYFQPASDSLECLNDGAQVGSRCECQKGFVGVRCEINLCYNYCFNGGSCVPTISYPKCTCPVGFAGIRCEQEVCKDYCLNGGRCKMNLKNVTQPTCDCPKAFSGLRCQNLKDPEQLCACQNGVIIIPIDGRDAYCSCDNQLNNIKQISENTTTVPHSMNLRTEADLFTEPLLLTFIFITIMLTFITISLSIAVCKMRHRRPRIKKRIIMNKNITPLTCRPLPTEQCEITIENCCNMNICETPCFEPHQLRGFQCSKKDEKKILITSMENGEDLY